jgi:D-glycero-D-manno-heptose 1,7-bisphosphate phosphatase
MGPAAAGLGGRLLAVVGWGMLEQFFPSTPRSGLAAPVEGNPQRTGRTVLIDRDGVINRNRPDHVKNWAEFEFLPGAVDALVYLARQGWRVVVVTNQALVERGFLSEAELGALHCRMAAEIVSQGGELAAVFSCPHRPEARCACRKPEPGLLLGVAEAFALEDWGDVVFIGDDWSDLQAAENAGCRSLLVLSGRVSEWTAAQLPPSCLGVAPDLFAAARLVVEGAARRASAPTVGGRSGC